MSPYDLYMFCNMAFQTIPPHELDTKDDLCSNFPEQTPSPEAAFHVLPVDFANICLLSLNYKKCVEYYVLKAPHECTPWMTLSYKLDGTEGKHAKQCYMLIHLYI